jgi:hypothetical protein
MPDVRAAYRVILTPLPVNEHGQARLVDLVAVTIRSRTVGSVA